MTLQFYNKKQAPNCLENVAHIVGVGAGKGGVGKSTLALHLALALQEKGKRVGLLDADVYGPSLALMCPFDEGPGREGEFLVPAKGGDLKLMSVAYFKRDAAVVRAPIANETINQFLKKTQWGTLDYLIVDFPPGTGDVQLTLLQEAPFAGAVLVTTPQKVALSDVKKAHECFERLRVPTLGIVENMSYFSAGGERLFPLGEGGGALLAKDIGCELLGQIPLEPLIALGGDAGHTLFDGEASAAKEAVLGIADKLNKFFDRHGGLQGIDLTFKQMSQAGSIEEKLDGSGIAGIEKIFQLGPKDLVIEWTDGALCRYDLGNVQRRCPCARCEKKPGGDGFAKSVRSVGRYGLKFEFTTGCSAGIFTFEALRAMKGIT